MFLAAFFMFTLKLVTEADVNVALNKVALYCGRIAQSSKILDGDKRLVNSVKIDKGCDGYSFLDIQLGAFYYVHYVIVYEGVPEGGLDYFWVENIDSDGTVSICSRYPSPSRGARYLKGMRVNCKVGLYNTVRIRSNQNKGFTIVEIEVFTIASGNARENVMMYHGCSESFYSHEILPIKRVKRCLTLCSKRYAFAGIKSARECHCGAFLVNTPFLPHSRCHYKCQEMRCGGPLTFSVYIVNIQLPFHHGCRDVTGLDGYTISGNMTVAKCLRRCKNYTMSAIKEGNDCLCLTWAFNVSYDLTQCNKPCTGDPKATCGGDNYAIIYKTSSLTNKILWLERLQCKIWNEFGSCTSPCRKAFQGSYCLESTMYDIPGNEEVEFATTAPRIQCQDQELCKNRTNTECLVVEGTQSCECLSGYARQVLNDTCVDLDECMFEPCDLATATCENQLGSYRCECLKGFHRVTHEICQRISFKLIPVCQTSPKSLVTLMIMMMIVMMVTTTLTNNQVGRQPHRRGKCPFLSYPPRNPRTRPSCDVWTDRTLAEERLIINCAMAPPPTDENTDRPKEEDIESTLGEDDD